MEKEKRWRIKIESLRAEKRGGGGRGGDCLKGENNYIKRITIQNWNKEQIHIERNQTGKQTDKQAERQPETEIEIRRNSKRQR